MMDLNKVIEEVKQDTLPFESWEQLKGESSLAFSAFCVFRDLGADRSIKKAVDVFEKDDGKREKRYGVWRNWATKFHWKDRASDYDRYLEQLKQTELRKTIEAQAEKHREVTGKMLDKVSLKLDLMSPDELTQNNVTEWVNTAIKADREGAGLVSDNGKSESQQGQLSFFTEFNGM